MIWSAQLVLPCMENSIGGPKWVQIVRARQRLELLEGALSEMPGDTRLAADGQCQSGGRKTCRGVEYQLRLGHAKGWVVGRFRHRIGICNGLREVHPSTLIQGVQMVHEGPPEPVEFDEAHRIAEQARKTVEKTKGLVVRSHRAIAEARQALDAPAIDSPLLGDHRH